MNGLADRALRFHSEVRDLCAKCETANRIQHDALEAAAFAQDAA